LSLIYTPLNHLLASGNRLRKYRWSLLQQLDIYILVLHILSNSTMGTNLASMSHILPGRAQVTLYRDKRTLLQLHAWSKQHHGDNTGFTVAYFAGESLSHVMPWWENLAATSCLKLVLRVYTFLLTHCDSLIGWAKVVITITEPLRSQSHSKHFMHLYFITLHLDTIAISKYTHIYLFLIILHTYVVSIVLLPIINIAHI